MNKFQFFKLASFNGKGSSDYVIIWLFLLEIVWPKVIPLSGAPAISFYNTNLALKIKTTVSYNFLFINTVSGFLVVAVLFWASFETSCFKLDLILNCFLGRIHVLGFLLSLGLDSGFFIVSKIWTLTQSSLLCFWALLYQGSLL